MEAITIRQQHTPFDEQHELKQARLLRELEALTEWHSQRCPEYRRVIDVIYQCARHFDSIESLPFLPVRLFKMMELLSVPSSEVVKTMMSSGTSSQNPSRIFLDKPTALAQTKALVTIIKSFLGPQRCPMMIIDSPKVLKDRNSFSARGAGILGFSSFGQNPVYLLNDDMSLNMEVLDQLQEAHRGKQVFLFGFTFMIWRYLYRACQDMGIHLDFGDSVLIHGGGWKKLADESVSNQAFKDALAEQLGIRRVFNYYGMVEQTGSIFMECEHGYFHPSMYSEVLVRDPDTLEVLPFGSSGIIQTFSILPRSYPGHSLLTEDLGTILGEDDCQCGRLGKYFAVHGRLPQAELRGCSDTHQESE